MWDKLKAALGKVGSAIKTVFVGAGTAVLKVFGGGDAKKGAEEMKAFGLLALHQLESELGQLVMKHVLRVNDYSGSGLQKYQMAFSGIVSEAEQNGVKWTEWAIDNLIQFAVGKVKGYYATN